MARIILIGLAAGAASALLFASIVSGNVLSVLLFYFSALPVMLAAIAWTHVAGLVAVAFGALALGFALNFWIGLMYVVVVGTPAYVLAYMAMLGRETAPASAGNAPQMEWYPAGRLLVWAALIAFGLAAIAVLQFGTSFETYQTMIRASFEKVLRLQAGIPTDQPLKLPGVQNPEAFLNTLVAIMPAAAAVLSMLTNLLNLWLAGRIARVSGKLQRPWPDLTTLSMPLGVALALAVALAVSFFSGMPGFIAAIAISVLTVAYALAGFSVLHAITQGRGARIWILAGTWLAVILFGWPLIFVALFGIADSIFDFRSRASRKPPFPPIQTNRS